MAALRKGLDTYFAIPSGEKKLYGCSSHSQVTGMSQYRHSRLRRSQECLASSDRSEVFLCELHIDSTPHEQPDVVQLRRHAGSSSPNPHGKSDGPIRYSDACMLISVGQSVLYVCWLRRLRSDPAFIPWLNIRVLTPSQYVLIHIGELKESSRKCGQPCQELSD